MGEVNFSEVMPGVVSDLHSLLSSDETYAKIRSSIDKWKSARDLLADTVRSYLSACVTLQTHCATHTRQASTNALITEAFTNVNSELKSLELEEQELRNMRISLATMRNQSMTLAPVNALPPEILLEIFSLAKAQCAQGKDETIEFYDLASVCAYWRRVALDNTELWAHIDIGPSIPEGLIRLLLGRTKNSPIHVHFYEFEYQSANVFKHNMEKILVLLAKHICRVYSLDIESYSSSRVLISSVVNLWLNSSNQDLPMTRSLLVYRPNGEVLLSSHGRSDKSLRCFSENARSVLNSISILHLQDVYFSWNNNVYHGLVDLRLSFPTDSSSMSTSQLAAILAASPQLVILKLANFTITQATEESKPSLITLNCLKVLNLVGMRHDDVKLLLPLFYVANPSRNLEVGLPACQHTPDELAAFFAHCCVSTFCYSFYRAGDALTLSPSLLPSLPSIPNMFLRRFDIEETSVAQTSTPFSFSYPSLHNVTLVSCSVTLNALARLVEQHQIQVLRLEQCNDLKEDREDLKNIQLSLSMLYPDLRCYVSDIDSTVQMPCYKMFDR